MNEKGEFDLPSGIAIDPTNSNRIYVTDIGDDHIQVFDSDGNYQDDVWK